MMPLGACDFSRLIDKIRHLLGISLSACIQDVIVFLDARQDLVSEVRCLPVDILTDIKCLFFNATGPKEDPAYRV